MDVSTQKFGNFDRNHCCSSPCLPCLPVCKGVLPGTGPIEGVLSKVSHVALYGFMTVMPGTGIAMGLYGGKGLPFFWTTIPGFEQKNGKIAGQSFKIHKQLGTYGKYLVPLHASAAFGHYFTNAPRIFTRINPFRGPPKH